MAGRRPRGEPRAVRHPRHRRRGRPRVRRTDLAGAQRLRGEIGHIQVAAGRSALRLRVVGLPGDDRGDSRLDAPREALLASRAGLDARRPLAARPPGDRRSRARRGRGRPRGRGRRGARDRRGRGRGPRPAERRPRGRRRRCRQRGLLPPRAHRRGEPAPHLSPTCSPTSRFRLAELGADAGVVGAARVG